MVTFSQFACGKGRNIFISQDPDKTGNITQVLLQFGRQDGSGQLRYKADWILYMPDPTMACGACDNCRDTRRIARYAFLVNGN